eukprot:5820599-Pleurochrysis_carterae.AAC.2
MSVFFACVATKAQDGAQHRKRSHQVVTQYKERLGETDDGTRPVTLDCRARHDTYGGRDLHLTSSAERSLCSRSAC